MGKKIKIRHIVQFIFFMLLFLTAIGHTLEESGVHLPFIEAASIHTLCPFGAVVSFYKLITTGTFVNKIHASAMVLFSATLFLSVLFGPVFCGWVCPLGTIQQWVSAAGKKLGLKGKFTVPPLLDRVLRNMRYLVLLWVVYVTAVSGELIFADYDPYYALFNFWSGEVAVSALIILGLTLALALFVERPWCKYACPFGALLGISNTFRVFGIKRNASTCISCQKCSKVCPMGIDVAHMTKVKDPQCISCYACTSEQACPVPDTVTIKIGGAKS